MITRGGGRVPLQGSPFFVRLKLILFLVWWSKVLVVKSIGHSYSQSVKFSILTEKIYILVKNMSSRSQRDLKSIRQHVRSDKSDTETDFELYLRSLLGVFIGAGDQQKSGVAAHRQHIQGQTRALKKIVDF